MNTIPTDAEIIFWVVALIIGLILLFVVLPILHNHIQNQEAKRMLSHYDYEEYHDDMEDWG